MLAPGNYVQWKSRIKIYIDTKPNNELIHYCLQNPPYTHQWTKKTVLVAEDHSHRIDNDMTPCCLLVEMACGNMMNELVKNQCDVTNHQVNVQFLLQLQPEWQRGTVYYNQRAVNVAGARENVGTLVVQKSGIQCYNCKEYGHIGKDDTDDGGLKSGIRSTIICTCNIQRGYLGLVDNSWNHLDDEPMLSSKGEFNVHTKSDFEKSSIYTQKINDLNQTISDMKKELCAHEETISIMSQAKEAHIKFYKTCKDKELDKVIALENKFKVLDDIVYKTGQSVQAMNMFNRNCKMSFAKLEFLKKAQRVNPRLCDIGYYNDNLALMLAPESDEMIRLDKESRSKLSDLIRPFNYD
ncbi:retrovirus-related pol polyprotein from transposon TNT 1-94 [Tanacetum coccineum]